MNDRTDWFHAARWGAASHYLSDFASNTTPVPFSPDEWNRRIDAFDVEGLADQLAAARVGFYMLTIGQNSGYYLSPNSAYDRFVGHQPSHCSRRDVIADLAAALDRRGIPLLAYLPSGAPTQDKTACAQLQWEWGFEGGHPHEGKRTGKRLREFQLMWEEVIREWSLRWGSLVRGWWFDGCYFADEMYRHSDAPNFHSFAAAARAGNPDSIVSFNAGIMLVPHSEAEDFTAGETNEPESLDCRDRWEVGTDGHREQYHMWSYLGKSWGSLPLRFTDAQAYLFTRRVVDHGGVTMWDVAIQQDGRLPSAAASQLSTLGTMLRDADRKGLIRPESERITLTQIRPAVRHEDGTMTPVAVQVRVENIGVEPVCGECRVALTTGEAVATFPYELEPGANKDQRLELAPGNGAFLLVTKAADPGVGQQIRLDEATEWTIPRLSDMQSLTDITTALQALPARQMPGVELRFGVCGESLVLSARVDDQDIRPIPLQPWGGSCVELLGSGAPVELTGDVVPCVNQFFLLPTTARNAAQVLLKIGEKLATVPEAELSGAQVPGGYILTLRIPLRLFPGWQPTSGHCRLEVVVTRTVGSPGAVKRRSLFNCIAPWSHAPGLSVARIDGEQNG